MSQVQIGGKPIGAGRTYVIAEIGINHNSDEKILEQLIITSRDAGVSAVKFQARTPEICVPKDQWEVRKRTPWGTEESYLEYRKGMEFTDVGWGEIDVLCRREEIDWFTSVWDEPAFRRIINHFPNIVAIKIPSACITDHHLLSEVSAWQSGQKVPTPVIISTGASTTEQIASAVSTYPWRNLIIMHCVSMYPCPTDKLVLREIHSLIATYGERGVEIGYSGHETGLATTYAAIGMGATVIERHVTLDRTMFGSDQAASIEPEGLRRLVRDIGNIDSALQYRAEIFPGEIKSMEKLRRIK